MSSFSKLGVAKFIASGIVGIGTGKIVKEIIKNNVAAPTTLVEKVTMISAAWVLGGIVSTASKKYSDDTIDDMVVNVNKVVDMVKESGKLARINRGESTFSTEGLDMRKFTRTNDKWVRVREDSAEETTTVVPTPTAI